VTVKPRVPELLRRPDFGRFWTGQTISLFGDQVTLIALPLAAVLVLHARAAQMGYLTAAALAPHLLFSIHAGAFVDRWGRRRVTMIVADVLRALLVATIPLAYALDALSLAHLYVVAFLIGTLSVFFSVADAGLFVALVRRDDYVQANSLLNGSRAFSFVAGPSVGGILVQLLKAPFALLVDALSYLASAFFLLRIAPAEPSTEQAESGHVTAGLRYIARSPVVRTSLGATATINFFNFVFFALFILYATRSLHVRPGTLGLVLGAGAVGGLIGSAITGRIGRRIGIGPAFILGCALFPAPLLLVPAAGGPKPVVLACLFLAEFGSGLGVMILDISVGSIFAALVPDRLRSRVSGAYSVVNYGVRPLGSLAGGALGAWIGLRPTLWIATAGALLGVLWFVGSPLPALRELPAKTEEGQPTPAETDALRSASPV
jgi:MFS family permease